MKTFDRLQIIYKNNKPYGIRDITGFLFFFSDVPKFQGQEERYRSEIQEQFELADYLLNALKSIEGDTRVASAKPLEYKPGWSLHEKL